VKLEVGRGQQFERKKPVRQVVKVKLRSTQLAVTDVTLNFRKKRLRNNQYGKRLSEILHTRIV
jgi:hypothetical protein